MTLVTHAYPSGENGFITVQTATGGTKTTIIAAGALSVDIAPGPTTVRVVLQSWSSDPSLVIIPATGPVDLSSLVPQTTVQTTFPGALTSASIGVAVPGFSASGQVLDRTGTPVGSATLPTLATVATSGQYVDLTGKPTIPTLPTLATVATSGQYADLAGKPTIPTLPALATVATSGQYADLAGKPSLTLVSLGAEPAIVRTGAVAGQVATLQAGGSLAFVSPAVGGAGGPSSLVYAAGAYPARSTITSVSTVPVTWQGPVDPVASGALAVDLWENTGGSVS